MDFKKLRKHLGKNLLATFDFLYEFNLKKEFSIENIALENFDSEEIQNSIDRSKYSKMLLIYVVSFQGVEAKELLACFRKVKKQTEKGSKNPLNRKLCRDNNIESDTNCLYVGSKKKDFHLRFKQHLGFGPKGTYALNLKYWLPKEAIIQFDVYSIEGLPKEEEKRQFFMEFVEQGIWELNKPLLGKKSGL